MEFSGFFRSFVGLFDLNEGSREYITGIFSLSLEKRTFFDLTTLHFHFGQLVNLSKHSPTNRISFRDL